MKMKNKFLKSLALPLALAGILATGGLLVNNNVENNLISSAEFSVVQTLKNDTPEYLKVKPKDEENDKLSYANENLFLFQSGQYFDLVIAEDEYTNSLGKTNYAYIPQKTNTQSFYYFDFQSTLSLYYNLTSDDVKNGLTNENLIKDQNISNYAKYNENGFVPNETSFTPQQFDIQFKLDLLQEKVTFEDKTVTLSKEGCYTIVIPVVEYYTTNGGLSFSSQERNVYYTFMAFNANTYFDSTTGKPKLNTSANLHQALLGTSSSEFSTYYYYNFAYGKNNVNTLPHISYSASQYQVKIDYTNIDNQTRSAWIEYQNGNIVQLDSNGDEIQEKDQFIKVIQTGETAKVVFYDLGSYDINISYLYTLSNLGGNTTFTLPFENLKPEENNNTIFKNKAQRLYIYGYQAVYSDYANTNPQTNQPESVDLKKYDYKNAKYNNSADITSQINNLAGLNTLSQSSKFDIKDAVTQAIIKNNIQPISTNQPPVKFLTNATNDPEISEIITCQDTDKDGKIDTFSEGKSFEGFNVNTAGTYLYIVQYKFNSYMSNNGTLQASYYHYQIFYFTITNTSPTVDVLNGDDFGEIYTNGYTNKSVYILNNAENNNYDANVKVTLSARDYNTNTYYFKDQDIKNLGAYGFNYQKFETSPNAEDESYNKNVGGKYGLFIDNTSQYANAEFEIKITSLMSNKPSVRKFTIDTNEIKNISARNVLVQSSTSYKITNDFEGYLTNTPFIMSWDDKNSGAKTYGYVKYIPTSTINYYSSLDDANLATLLARLIDTHDTLPVSNKIDLAGAKDATWTEYSNSNTYSTTVPSNYVKSGEGFYILQVYDQAGNVGFEIFLLDSSAPIFVEEITGDSISQKILSNSESLTVPESNVNITIKWTSNKAIYLENMTDEVLSSVKSYQYAINADYATKLLQEKNIIL